MTVGDPPAVLRAAGPAVGVPAPDHAREAVALLRQLVRLDTSNPPGRERVAIELVATRLASVGFVCETLAADPERPNLIARLPGHAPGPTLCLTGHVDTVTAHAHQWRHDPWSAELAEGCVWGRGTVDMKGQVAAEVAAAAWLAAGGWRPARGELLLLIVADEEVGFGVGAEWLAAEHPERIRFDWLLNEGAGEWFELDGRRYGVSVAEKGVYRFTLTATGVAGHASTPGVGDNALLRLVPALTRLSERRLPFDVVPEAASFLRLIRADPRDPAAALERIGRIEPALVPLLEPMLGITVAPTRISASDQTNVIPNHAQVTVDCRVPPGLGEAEVAARLDSLLEGLDVERAFVERVPGNSSPVESPLMDAIRSWVAAADPGASVVPLISTGFTDSRHLRAAVPDGIAYGFFPQRHVDRLQTSRLIHAPDERLDVRDLAFATACYADLTRTLLGG